VPEDVSPTEAQLLYEQYLTAHFGSQLRARFEQEKTMDRCGTCSGCACQVLHLNCCCLYERLQSAGA
jgi:hypothetical protein